MLVVSFFDGGADAPMEAAAAGLIDGVDIVASFGSSLVSVVVYSVLGVQY
jgi:sugar (pentulose or hexulose) kinase